MLYPPTPQPLGRARPPSLWFTQRGQRHVLGPTFVGAYTASAAIGPGAAGRAAPSAKSPAGRVISTTSHEEKRGQGTLTRQRRSRSIERISQICSSAIHVDGVRPPGHTSTQGRSFPSRQPRELAMGRSGLGNGKKRQWKNLRPSPTSARIGVDEAWAAFPRVRPSRYRRRRVPPGSHLPPSLDACGVPQHNVVHARARGPRPAKKSLRFFYESVLLFGRRAATCEHQLARRQKSGWDRPAHARDPRLVGTARRPETARGSNIIQTDRVDQTVPITEGKQGVFVT